ncbi:MAG: carboxypeptidase-like regulatory domain-containing protein [Flavobacteriales bacterium]|jgi:hypothetical protein
MIEFTLKEMAAIRLCIFFLFASFASLGQKLEQRVSIDMRDQSTKNILLRLETVADVKFSYTNQVLQAEKKASVKAQQAPLKAVLIHLLGTGYKFKEVKGYIIISKEKIDDDEILVKGYVYDSKGAPLDNATVYERKSMRSRNTDPNGYYELRIKRNVAPDSIFIRKYNYSGNDLGLKDSAFAHTSSLSQADVRDMTALNILHRGKDQVAQSIASFWHKHQLVTLNVQDTIYRKFQVTFVPYIGTNRKLSGNSINTISFNILGGYALANEGVEFAGLFNTNRGYSKGVQFAGLYNINLESSVGAQFAGLFNVNGAKSQGAQFAGLFNHNAGSFKGVQFAGLYNLNQDSLTGAQFAGLFNFNQGNCDGPQFAGFLNSNAQRNTAMAIAGFMNIHSDIPLQIAPFNIAKESRAQIGVINVASHSKFQLGVINIADSVSGVPIGVLNFVKNGYHKLDVGYDSEAHLNLSFRTGVPALYTILSSTIRPQHRDSTEWSFGYGIGTSPRLGKRVRWNIDITSHQMVEGGRIEHLQLTNRLSTGVEYQITSWFAVYAAFVANHAFYEMDSTYNPYSEPRNIVYSTSDNRYKSEVWPGWRFGIRFF